jgi:hypothetical protein
MHHDVVGKPQAGKYQQTGEKDGDGIDNHAMPILIVAFRAFIFHEIWDR